MMLTAVSLAIAGAAMKVARVGATTADCKRIIQGTPDCAASGRRIGSNSAESNRGLPFQSIIGWDNTMARVYLDKYNGYPLFSPEQTVGLNMSNASADVKLIQLLLKAIMHGGKSFLGTDIKFTPPEDSPKIEITGSWDLASKNYLHRWEMLRSDARSYWSPTHHRDTIQFPGTVVPWSQGGRKIIVMQEMCVTMFGRAPYATL